MGIKRKKWVVGFLIKNKREVALVLKTHPHWQSGKLNGVGGKIDKGESALRAMRREFKEEAGLSIKDWRKFCLLKAQDGDAHFFVAHGSGKLISKTDERVGWYNIEKLDQLPVIANLMWLIPMALDPGTKQGSVTYVQPHT